MALNKAVESLYGDHSLVLGKDSPHLDFDSEVFTRAAEWIHRRGGFTPEMLSEQPARAVMGETFRILGAAVSSGISVQMPDDLAAMLQNNAFIFSGLKTYHSLAQVGLSLIGANGRIKPFEQFSRDVTKIDQKYNRNYLYAEYNHAVSSAQMASKWHDFEADGDRYDLQYRTAGDDRVREEHIRLNNITLPQNDPFWSQFLPPNGWNCRCTVVQVRKGKYPLSDSAQSIATGEQITAQPKQQIFRFNPGKELKIFPDKHPYNKAPQQAKEVIKDMAREIKTPGDVVEFINGSAERRGWFERGFNSLIATTQKGVNGYTDMKGRIALTQNRLDDVLKGLTQIRNGGEVTIAQADALATFWHEITHNRNKLGNMRMTRLQVNCMELANEFVARKTLPDFYKSVGGKMQHREFMDNRDSTGYNQWVRNYCKAIEQTGANAEGVLADVQEHLFNQPYNDQATGLANALIKNGARKNDGTKLKKMEVNRIIKGCLCEHSDSLFEEYMKSIR